MIFRTQGTRKNEDLLKDSPETGWEGYTENVEATPGCPCQGDGGILLLEKKGTPQ